jgi:hypothetical protein
VVCVRVGKHTSRCVYLRVLLLHQEGLEGTDQEENPAITDYYVTYCHVWNLKLRVHYQGEGIMLTVMYLNYGKIEKLYMRQRLLI